MATTTAIRARQGDTVDAICYRYYGRTAGHVERVLEANPGLADLGPIVPLDTAIDMPAASTATRATTKPTINLWD